MTKLNKLSLALAMAAGMASVAPAHAFSLGGWDGPVTMIMYGVDQGSLYSQSCSGQAACDSPANLAFGAAGGVGSEDSWGIFKISAIEKLVNGSAAGALWTAGPGEYLVGSYGGLTDQAAGVIYDGFTNTTTQTTVSTGGFMNLYLVNSLAGYDAAVAAGAAGRVGQSVTGIDGVGVNFLTASFSGTALNSFVGLPMTSHYIYGSQGGYANGYLDITGGDYADLFKRDTIQDQESPGSNFVDIGFSTQNLQGANLPTNWTVGYSGNIQTGVIPEPATLALLGLGLIGLASIRRRS